METNLINAFNSSFYHIKGEFENFFVNYNDNEEVTLEKVITILFENLGRGELSINSIGTLETKDYNVYITSGYDDYYFTLSYGTCSACDTIMKIDALDDKEKINALMRLSSNIILACKQENVDNNVDSSYDSIFGDTVASPVSVPEKGDINEFNKGWWNCFCSYTDNMYFFSTRGDLFEAASNQLKEAGITDDEIDYVLNNISMTENTKRIITEYKDGL